MTLKIDGERKTTLPVGQGLEDEPSGVNGDKGDAGRGKDRTGEVSQCWRTSSVRRKEHTFTSKRNLHTPITRPQWPLSELKLDVRGRPSRKCEDAMGINSQVAAGPGHTASQMSKIYGVVLNMRVDPVVLLSLRPSRITGSGVTTMNVQRASQSMAVSKCRVVPFSRFGSPLGVCSSPSTMTRLVSSTPSPPPGRAQTRQCDRLDSHIHLHAHNGRLPPMMDNLDRWRRG